MCCGHDNETKINIEPFLKKKNNNENTFTAGIKSEAMTIYVDLCCTCNLIRLANSLLMRTNHDVCCITNDYITPYALLSKLNATAVVVVFVWMLFYFIMLFCFVRVCFGGFW